MSDLRRLVLSAFSGAAFLVACAGGECHDAVTIVVTADKACPSREAAANSTASYRDDPVVESPPVVELLVPGTICWYLATFPGRDCPEWATRSAALDALNNRAEEPFDSVTACEEGQHFHGKWFPAPVTTQREAAAATPIECPPEANLGGQGGEGGEGGSGNDRLGALAGSDFIEARILCHYDVEYECDGGCGSVSMGLE